jgi:hypothetical protein
MPRQTRSVNSAAASVVPLPRNGSLQPLYDAASHYALEYVFGRKQEPRHHS